MTTTDILTAIEVDDRLEQLTEGQFGARHVEAVSVHEVSRKASVDGFPFWKVEVVCGGLTFALRSFRAANKQAAVLYGELVADALGLELSR